MLELSIRTAANRMRTTAMRFPARNFRLEFSPRLSQVFEFDGAPYPVVVTFVLEKGSVGEANRWHLSLLYENGEMVPDEIVRKLLGEFFPDTVPEELPRPPNNSLRHWMTDVPVIN